MGECTGAAITATAAVDVRTDSATVADFERRLSAALERRAAVGETVRFWWRDDDATRSGPRLQRLLQATRGSPLALAVIPKLASQSLAEAVAAEPRISVFQHGWAHVNHAPRGRGLGAWELDAYRQPSEVLAQTAEGQSKLERLFGQSFTPVMVPPWNRIHDPLLPGLADQGFIGLSAMGIERACIPTPGLKRIDCRFDVLRWKRGAGFAGWSKAAGCLEKALAEGDGIVGINTHHAVTDEEGWRFIDRLNRFVQEHPGATWAQPRTLFAAL